MAALWVCSVQNPGLVRFDRMSNFSMTYMTLADKVGMLCFEWNGYVFFPVSRGQHFKKKFVANRQLVYHVLKTTTRDD
eukprot:5966917-Amphidinium_carterae.1